MTPGQLAQQIEFHRDGLKEILNSEAFLAALYDAPPEVERAVRYKLWNAQLSCCDAISEIAHRVTERTTTT